MKLLYIGPYKQNDLWGHYSQDFVRSLLCSSQDVTIRPIYMAPYIDNNIDATFTALEHKSHDKYDIVIQHCLPILFHYDGTIPRNVGMFQFESTLPTTWKHFIKLMPEVLVSTKYECIQLGNKGIRIPRGVDVSKFERSYQKFDFSGNDNFKFYYIGEYEDRKNIQALVKAFHLEFNRSEPVELVINTYKEGIPTEQLLAKINEDFKNIKVALRVYKNADSYKKEIVICKKLNTEELGTIHNSCDCFVMPSQGESWESHTFDAMGFGKTPIVTYDTGMSDYIDFETGYPALSDLHHCETSDAPLPELYTGHEKWREVSIDSLRHQMRNALTRSEAIVKTGKARVYDYSYDKIGKMIDAFANK